MDKRQYGLKEWGAEVLRTRLPRWKQLPSIDLYMDQVVVLLEQYLRLYMPGEDNFLTPAMINNYVKSRILPPPEKKRYNRVHIAGLVFVCTLKQLLSIADIHALLLRDTQLENLPQVYDGFCDALETSYASVVQACLYAGVQQDVDTFSSCCVDALHLALLSAASKTMAQRLLNQQEQR